MATIDLMDQFSHLGEGGIRNNGTLDAEVTFQHSLRTKRTDFIQVKAGDSIVYKNMSGMSSIWNILSFYTGDAQGFYVSGIAGQTTPQSGVWTAQQDGYVRLFGSFPAGDNISVTMTDLAPDVDDYLAKYNAMNYRFLPNSIPKIVAHIQEYLSNHPIADSTTLQSIIDSAFQSYMEEIHETADTYISEAVPPAAAAAVDAAASPALQEITAKAAEAAESARQAGLSQQSAEMSEENALTYRNQAQQIKDSITAEVAASVLAAQEQATLAQGSAQAADESANTAEQYVAQARAQAEAAADQAQNASGYASDAQGYMQDASSFAQNASDFADNAAQSAATFSTDTTLTIAGKAADAKVTGDQLSALKSAFEDRVPKYGAAGFNNSNPDLTRMYDAVGKTAQVGTDGDNSDVVNDFDNIAPFNRRKCVGHWEAGADRAVFVVEAYEGDPDYAEDGTMGDYVAVDCTPAYVWESADRDIRAVSPMKLNGFRPFACLASKDDPTVCREHTYLPVYALAFDENGHAVSLPGYSNRQGDYASLLSAAKQYANTDVQQYCHLMPDDVAFYEETLYDIEFATHNCQSIMEGCVNLRHNNDDRVEMLDATHWLIHNYQAARVAGEFISIQPTNVDYNNANYYASHKIVSITRCDASGNADASGTYQLIETEDLGLGRTYEVGTEYRIAARPYNTGACAGVSTPSGSPVSNSDGLHPMKYRHRENVLGNQNQTTMDLFDLIVGEEGAYELEWYKMKDLDAGIVKNYGAEDMAGDNFVKLGYVTPYENYKNGYITEEVCDERYPDNRIPVVGSGGSAAKFVCDYAYLVSSYVIRSVRRFGSWYLGAYAGFGSRNAYNAPSISLAIFGGGLYMTQ